MKCQFVAPFWSIVLGVFGGLIIQDVSARRTSLPVDTRFITTHWTTENGLPQNTVTAVVQTQDGYLWLGTFGGLARFDGLKFTIFNTSNTPIFKSNRITALYVSRDGKLWIGAETREIYCYSNGVFRYFATVDMGEGYNFIQTIYEDKAGAMYFGTETTGLTRFENQDPAQSTHFERNSGLPDSSVTSISEAAEGNLWVVTPLGLAEFHNGRIISTQQIQTNSEDRPIAITPHQDGGFWLITKSGIGHLKDRRYSVHYSFATKSRLWATLISGRTSGVCFSPDSNQILCEKSGEFFSRKATLAKNYGTRSLYEDTAGNLWMGTIGDGLYRLSPRNISMLQVSEGGELISAWTITQDHQHNIWLGTENGLQRISGQRITTYFRNTIPYKLPGWYISALYVAKDDSLWIGHLYGIAHLQHGKCTAYKYPQLERVAAITEDRLGQIWLGTQNGLARFQAGQFKFFRQSDGLVHTEVKVLFEDREGALWIGTVKGLSRFKDGVFTNYTTREGLSNDYVRDIYEDEDGALWIATYGGGLNWFQAGHFEHLTTTNGLPDDFLTRILVVDMNQFWLLGNRGIFSLDRRTLNDYLSSKTKMVLCNNFGVSDGLEVTEGNGGNFPAGWRMQNGQLWFPMIRGIAIVTPDPHKPQPPLVALEQIFLDGKLQDYLHPIEIAPDTDNLEIQYTGIALTKPEQVQFMYKLEGFDNDWITAGSRRTALYSQLPPGDYVFRLRAANPAGGWSLHDATAIIKVRPRFWQTLWARLLFGTFTLGFLIISYFWTISRFRRSASQKENFARQLIASQERERQRIAVEMHDGLSQSLVIIKRRALVCLESLDDPEKVQEQLQEIAEASTYAIDEVKEVIFDLRPRQLDRLGVSEAISDLLDRVSALHAWQLTKHLDDLAGVFTKEEENNLYRIVQEILNNISKHAAASQVAIKISRKPQRIELTVADNGCGFEVSRLVARKTLGGLGLQNIIERTKLLSGETLIRAAPGRGTIIRLSLPVKDNPV